MFILFAFDWDGIYWYLEEEMGEEEAEEMDNPNPMWDIGKTIPDFVSFDAGYIDQFQAPYLLCFSKKGRWVPVGYQSSRGFYY